MLSAANRMRKPDEFVRTTRNGRRSGNQLLVVYFNDDSINEADLFTKVGFVVGKKVGNSVVRHRIVRQLRHIVRGLLPDLRYGSLVVRVLPAARGASSADLEDALVILLRRIGVLMDEFPSVAGSQSIQSAGGKGD